jgi:hypothetical protein
MAGLKLELAPLNYIQMFEALNNIPHETLNYFRYLDGLVVFWNKSF